MPWRKKEACSKLTNLWKRLRLSWPYILEIFSSWKPLGQSVCLSVILGDKRHALHMWSRWEQWRLCWTYRYYNFQLFHVTFSRHLNTIFNCPGLLILHFLSVIFPQISIYLNCALIYIKMLEYINTYFYIFKCLYNYTNWY